MTKKTKTTVEAALHWCGKDLDRARFLLLAMDVIASLPPADRDDANARHSAIMGEVMLHTPRLARYALSAARPL